MTYFGERKDDDPSLCGSPTKSVPSKQEVTDVRNDHKHYRYMPTLSKRIGHNSPRRQARQLLYPMPRAAVQ
jgi:hypothetical protein